MKVIKKILSESDLQSLIGSLDFTGKKEIVCSLGSNLYIRAYPSNNVIFFYREPKTCKLIRLGVYTEELSYNEARKKCKTLMSSRKASSDNSVPLFGELALIWLNSKRNLARYNNIKKCVEYLSPLNQFKLDEIRILNVKNALFNNPRITPYKLHESLDVFCRIMDLAVENEYIQNHNFRILKRSQELPEHIPSSGYKYVEFNELKDILFMMRYLSEMMKCYFLMQIFTCLRSGECRQLKFEYFKIEKKMIVIDGKIMKVKTAEPFRIPLTVHIKCLYEHIKHYHQINNIHSDYLFPNKTQKGCLAERDLSIEIKIATNSRVHAHGFRKTARSFFADKLVPLEVSAMCLAHKLHTGADSVYQKSDLFNARVDVMQMWNDAVVSIIPNEFKILLDKANI